MQRVREDMEAIRIASAAPLTRGHAELFAHEVLATRADLGRFAFLLVGSSAGAEDLLAEAYARAWPHFKRGEIDHLPAYLRRSIANLANGRLRRLRLERRELATRRVDWRAPRLESPDGGYEDRVELQDQLWRAIWSLPVHQRVVVVLRHAEDRSEEETAELLGISVGTVKSRLARGLDSLRERLERSQAAAPHATARKRRGDERENGRR